MDRSYLIPMSFGTPVPMRPVSDVRLGSRGLRANLEK
jgi:hypothetical protein